MILISKYHLKTVIFSIYVLHVKIN